MFNSRSLLPLSSNADLVDRLLTSLLDFESLQAFISSSKFVYSVFRCRQNSILGAVAHNQFGPTLPQAIRLVKYLDGTSPVELTHELQWEAALAQDLTITPAQVCILRDHAATVRALEDIYSWREKDPRFRSSRLTTAESLKFQQSVYRFWLLTSAYGPGALVDERPRSSDRDHPQLKDLVVIKQITCLSSLEEIELMGVGEVHGFLLDLARWAIVKHTTRPMRFGYQDDIYLVWGGPAVTLDAFKGKWPFHSIDLQRYDGWRAMTHAFLASEIVAINSGRVLSTAWQRFIIDDCFLKAVDCNRCTGSRRDSLWSFCNWEYLILAIAPSRLANFLSFEKRRPLELLVSFTKAVESIPYSQFIGEIFDIRSERYRDWQKDDWLCTHCMSKLLSDNVQTWLDKRIAEADATLIHW